MSTACRTRWGESSTKPVAIAIVSLLSIASLPTAAAEPGAAFCAIPEGWHEVQGSAWFARQHEEGHGAAASAGAGIGGCLLARLPYAIRVLATPETNGCYSNADFDRDGYAEVDVNAGLIIPPWTDVWLYCQAPKWGGGGIVFL